MKNFFDGFSYVFFALSLFMIGFTFTVLWLVLSILKLFFMGIFRFKRKTVFQILIRSYLSLIVCHELKTKVSENPEQRRWRN